jgi:hypothetical protein
MGKHNKGMGMVGRFLAFVFWLIVVGVLLGIFYHLAQIH